MLLIILGDGVVANVVLSKNPVRDLGPRLAHALLPVAGKGGSEWGYAWIPVAGPIVGGVIAALLYKIWWPA